MGRGRANVLCHQVSFPQKHGVRVKVVNTRLKMPILSRILCKKYKRDSEKD